MSVRAHHLALFTSRKLNMLVSTTGFFKDIKKNKSKILWPKNIKNIIVLDTCVNFLEYQNLLELIKGSQDFMNMRNIEMDNNVLFLIDTAENKNSNELTVKEEF